MQDGTALINDGSATCPTAPTTQPAGNIGDSWGPPSMAGSPTPTAPAAQPVGSLHVGDNPGSHPSVSVNLIELDSPATTPSPASEQIQGLMANLDIN